MDFAIWIPQEEPTMAMKRGYITIQGKKCPLEECAKKLTKYVYLRITPAEEGNSTFKRLSYFDITNLLRKYGVFSGDFAHFDDHIDIAFCEGIDTEKCLAEVDGAEVTRHTASKEAQNQTVTIKLHLYRMQYPMMHSRVYVRNLDPGVTEHDVYKCIRDGLEAGVSLGAGDCWVTILDSHEARTLPEFKRESLDTKERYALVRFKHPDDQYFVLHDKTQAFKIHDKPVEISEHFRQDHMVDLEKKKLEHTVTISNVLRGHEASIEKSLIEHFGLIDSIRFFQVPGAPGTTTGRGSVTFKDKESADKALLVSHITISNTPYTLLISKHEHPPKRTLHIQNIFMVSGKDELMKILKDFRADDGLLNVGFLTSMSRKQSDERMSSAHLVYETQVQAEVAFMALYGKSYNDQNFHVQFHLSKFVRVQGVQHGFGSPASRSIRISKIRAGTHPNAIIARCSRYGNIKTGSFKMTIDSKNDSQTYSATLEYEQFADVVRARTALSELIYNSNPQLFRYPGHETLHDSGDWSLEPQYQYPMSDEEDDKGRVKVDGSRKRKLPSKDGRRQQGSKKNAKTGGRGRGRRSKRGRHGRGRGRRSANMAPQPGHRQPHYHSRQQHVPSVGGHNPAHPQGQHPGGYPPIGGPDWDRPRPQRRGGPHRYHQGPPQGRPHQPAASHQRHPNKWAS